MENFAPVLIPTLNRHIHFKRCVDSLAACIYADKTDLYIAFDYPLNESHWNGYKIIKEYLPTIKGFKSVNIFERNINYGAKNNIHDARKRVFEKYDRLIFTEDDNIFAPDFLNFVNTGLEVYKNRKDIFSIIGYQYPVSIPRCYNKEIYLYQGFSAWGYGTWKDKWEKVIWDIADIKSFIEDKDQIKNLNNKNLVSSLQRIIETGNILGDVFICYYQFNNNMYSVFPVVSRVRNNGHDGSGIHGGNNNSVRKIYLNQPISNGNLECTFPPDILPNKDFIAHLKKHFKPSIIKAIKNNPNLILKKIKKMFAI